MRIFNTAVRMKEEIKWKDVRIYVCGVTVYDICHIGHARSLVIFDTFVRYLRARGYNVKYVRNFTDIDDKIIERAKKEGLKPEEVAEKYIEEFYKDTEPLGLIKPDFEPRVTEHIPDIVLLVKRILDKGYAYVSGGNVYFSVRSFPEYGRLSGRTLDEMLTGVRVEPGEGKRDPLDFALWKESRVDEPGFDSPWGRGRPGWHIECSAMSMKYLGETFEIHGGGQDLIFPHHENEIAQSESATGKPFVKIWMHTGFLTVKGEKMSKSLGNVVTLKELYKRYHPEVIRFLILSHHYRSPIDFSFSALDEAEKTLINFYLNAEGEGKPEGLLTEFEEAMDDDLNTPKAISAVFSRLGKNLKNIDYVYNVLGIFVSEDFLERTVEMRLVNAGMTKDELSFLVRRREELRRVKDYAEADKIRSHLKEKGIYLQDTLKGTRVIPC